MVHSNHPAIQNFEQFYMSSDFFYFISKLKFLDDVKNEDLPSISD